MGYLHKVSRSVYDSSTTPDYKGNPNPKNYKILGTATCGNNIAIMIEYPDCKNYEGRKILVYKNRHIDDLKELSEGIDPHFDDKNIGPFARFRPTKFGWDAAIKLIEVI